MISADLKTSHNGAYTGVIVIKPIFESIAYVTIGNIFYLFIYFSKCLHNEQAEAADAYNSIIIWGTSCFVCLEEITQQCSRCTLTPNVKIGNNYDSENEEVLLLNICLPAHLAPH